MDGLVYSGTKEVKTEFFFPNKFPYGAEPVKIISLFFEFHSSQNLLSQYGDI